MLQSLTVENYALIDYMELSLDGGLNIITGETGAGKSILLGALGLLLGNKNEGSAIKDNTKNCVIEGLFNISTLGLKPHFEEMDWEWEERITIRRVISPSGKSRAFIGDIPATLSELKILASKLIDVHSQHQNMLLSSEAFRTDTLDSIAQNGEVLSTYSELYTTLNTLRAELATLEEGLARSSRDQEWISHQVEELESARLTAGEDAVIEEELQILENAESIGEVLNNLTARLDSDQTGVISQLKASQNELRTISKKFHYAAEYASRMDSILAELKDINSSAAHDSERVEADPERLERLSQRLGTIYTLCQKHRATNLTELIAIRDDYTAQLERITNSDSTIERLREEVYSCEKRAMEVAKEIESRRKGAIEIFEQNIASTLDRLGMGQAEIKVRIVERDKLCPTGINSVDYLFTSAKGSTPQPIDKIASGGETSRVMLALKSLLARYKSMPTVIFDEIDTGVSGHIAEAMGEIISTLATTMQVVDITHLPQVAAKGETHFVVYKERGRTNIKRLTQEERVMQIATMISGAHVSDAALQQARNLLDI